MARDRAGGRRPRGSRSRWWTGGASWRCSPTRSSGCRSAGAPHLVTLLGEPGIGKSRVVEEFLGDPARRGEGPLRPLEPVRGGGHVLAARPDGLPRDRRGARRSGGAGPRSASARSWPAGWSPTRSTGRCAGWGSRWGSARRAARRTATTRPRSAAACLAMLTGLASRRTGRAGLRGPARGRSAPARPDRAARQGGPQGAADDGVRGPLGVPGAAAELGRRPRRRGDALGGAAHARARHRAGR